MIYRERRAARAERLRRWADSHETKAEAAYGAASEYVENVPLGQPILVDHHSESRARRDHARFNANMRKSFDHTAKAEEMRSKAANIDAAAQHAIYSDDPDAVEHLGTKLAELEATRDRIKTYNKTVKGESKDLAVLTREEVSYLMSSRNSYANGFDPGWKYPAYVLSNLSGNINRIRKRLKALGAQARTPRAVRI